MFNSLTIDYKSHHFKKEFPILIEMYLKHIHSFSRTYDSNVENKGLRLLKEYFFNGMFITTWFSGWNKMYTHFFIRTDSILLYLTDKRISG